MHTLSSKNKLKVNNVKDTLITEKSHQLVKTSNTNTKSAFVLSATICHNYGGCRHLI
jgi:hypothetical protein